MTLSGLLTVDTTITVNPGGHSVTVLLSAGLLCGSKPGPCGPAAWSLFPLMPAWQA